jgi:hypothetical protein
MDYRVFILAAALAAASSAARADVTITSETVSAKGGATARTVYLTADHMKVDSPKTAVLFDIAAAKITTIMKEKKQYVEMDVKAVGAAASDVKALVDSKLQGMPESQRKMIEGLMGKHGATPGAMTGAPIKLTYEKTGESKTIGAWACDVYHQKRDGKLISDLCIAKAGDVGLTDKDLEPLRTLAHTIKKSLPESISRAAGEMDFDEQTRQIGFAGIPVEAVVYAKDAVATTTTVKSVDHGAIPVDAFAIPEGFAKKEFPGAGALGMMAKPQ